MTAKRLTESTWLIELHRVLKRYSKNVKRERGQGDEGFITYQVGEVRALLDVITARVDAIESKEYTRIMAPDPLQKPFIVHDLSHTLTQNALKLNGAYIDGNDQGLIFTANRIISILDAIEDSVVAIKQDASDRLKDK
ncbi:hypothetical protein NCPPB3778_70 [Rathayibacter phage NCPPB3778]|nr:hypothetical protein NCPPB3778_70 [Rathayibacter phage NCPPB3778]